MKKVRISCEFLRKIPHWIFNNYRKFGNFDIESDIQNTTFSEKMRIINKMVNGNSDEKTQKVEITEDRLYHCETVEDYE